MSHQRYPSHDATKEPHSVSVKVLRLSRPSLVPQYPSSPLPPQQPDAFLPASLAYKTSDTNPAPFLLSPILNLPISFGSAYVGETFSCTLCANNDVPAGGSTGPTRQIRDVRIEAEMKTPGVAAAHKLPLSSGASDLAGGETLQQVVNFDLKEEGNHVLAVTVSYYEASETSGRTRTFRKLYQFICKASLIVRTKVGLLSGDGREVPRKWVLEAQLENCSLDVMQLDKVGMQVEDGLACEECNWEDGERPVLHPGEMEQVCFVVEEEQVGGAEATGGGDGRIVFGVLGIGWRGEMGNRGFLSTGKLGTRVA